MDRALEFAPACHRFKILKAECLAMLGRYPEAQSVARYEAGPGGPWCTRYHWMGAVWQLSTAGATVCPGLIRPSWDLKPKVRPDLKTHRMCESTYSKYFSCFASHMVLLQLFDSATIVHMWPSMISGWCG